MIEIAFIGDDKFLFGIRELQGQLKFTLSENGYIIYAEKTDVGSLKVKTNTESALIEYPADNLFFRGLSLALEHAGQVAEISVKPLLSQIGTMQDCSDGLLSTEGLKGFIRQSALMGYTYMGMYMETSYTVEDEPYFGYKSGRYSAEELSEIVLYGEKFQVEVIPFIQTLAHLNQLFRWPAYYEVFDTHDTLLAGYERTYELIENMLKSLRKSFKTERINLGMDEAYYMGFGRYHWFIDENDFDTVSLFISHLKRVIAIAGKYGFSKPEIWFDNVFGIKFKGYINPPDWLFRDFEEKIAKAFPDVTMRFWNYAVRDVKEFTRCCGQIRQLTDKITFASAVHGYTSFAPLNRKTGRLVKPALKGCLKNGIDDLVITEWAGMRSPFAMLPAYYDFTEGIAETYGYDAKKHFKFLFGYSYGEFLKLDIPNELSFDGKADDGVGEIDPPFYILADDPLFGTMEKHIPDNTKAYYERSAKILGELSKRNSEFSYLFEFEKTLCETLAVKSDLSKRVKLYYDEGNKEGLKGIISEIPFISEKIRSFHIAFYYYWVKFNKRVGFEIFDQRLGGIILRFDTVKGILNDLVTEKIDRIEELDEERLPVNKGTENKVVCYGDWNKIALGRITRL